ncbi:hypothetical protein [Xanthomonas sacchari]|uniref:hypothetical protein n=1 Tax=Xanthomonas sacchari TaxID=56458 RepID=UPI000B29FC0C|nr:hypothetical protein [Xanthomonas sacchari]
MALRAPARAATTQDTWARSAPTDDARQAKLAAAARAQAAATGSSEALSLQPSTSSAAPTAASAQPRSSAGVLAAAVEVAVEADAQLPPRRWLQRIRERRDGGELDVARASLLRFQRTHPHSTVPADLRPLLQD